MYKKGDEVEMRDSTAFVCPFCKKKCVYGTVVGSGDSMLSHMQPACKKFLELPIPEFMRACAREYKKTAPS